MKKLDTQLLSNEMPEFIQPSLWRPIVQTEIRLITILGRWCRTE